MNTVNVNGVPVDGINYIGEMVLDGNCSQTVWTILKLMLNR